VFLICDQCHSAEELHAVATSNALKSETRGAGFHMTRAVVEVRGTCRNCAA
jgi:Fur family zinc uptake transcriptional regulator